MARLQLQVVTAERVTYSDEADVVVAPGVVGQLGILPNHAPLLTQLAVGPLIARKDGTEVVLALTGGFMEVRDNQVIVLAESAERADEIDTARAEAARERALALLREPHDKAQSLQAAQALQRSLVRLKVARPRRRQPGPSEGNAQ
ncbi:MAG: F0F1 ATP synthase subunit epsilon [Chloroflexota bacterium]